MLEMRKLSRRRLLRVRGAYLSTLSQCLLMGCKQMRAFPSSVVHSDSPIAWPPLEA